MDSEFYIERQLKSTLSKWHRKNNKKPIVLRGIRRVGKTEFVNRFGKDNFEKIAYFNFKENDKLRKIFEIDRDPKEMIEWLSYYFGGRINPDTTLIHFDDIDHCIDASNYLPRFNELAKRFSIIGSGSYFYDFDKQKSESYDKSVERMNLYPINFKEWLNSTSQICAASYTHYYKYGNFKPIKPKFHKMLTERFEQFLLVGGMPEALQIYKLTKSFDQAIIINETIKTIIESDFLKWNRASRAKKILEVWNSIPKQLANTNLKFMYSKVGEFVKGRNCKGAIYWLTQNGLFSKIRNYNVTSKLKGGFQLIPSETFVLKGGINKVSVHLIYMLNQIQKNGNEMSYLSKNKYNLIIPNSNNGVGQVVQIKAKMLSYKMSINSDQDIGTIEIPTYMTTDLGKIIFKN